MLVGGRWNSPGLAVIYAAETYAGALLEVLVHANLSRIPKSHMVIEITIPDQVTTETVLAADLKGWDDEDLVASRAFGDRWIKEGRTAVLKVPGVVTDGRENNVVINTAHPQFPLIRATAPEPVHWDGRLFRPNRG